MYREHQVPVDLQDHRETQARMVTQVIEVIQESLAHLEMMVQLETLDHLEPGGLQVMTEQV